MDPLFVDIKTAAGMLGLGETKVREFIRRKDLRVTYFDTAPRISMRELERFSESMEQRA